MEKITATACLLLIISFFLVVFPEVNVNATTNTTVVPLDYSNIQDAINNAANGDTIKVKEGVYYGKIEVNKELTIIGENKHTTIIDGNEQGPVILITQNKVTVKDLTIRNGMDSFFNYFFKAHTGIHLLHVNHCEVSNNILDNNGFGVWLFGSSDNKISHNELVNNRESMLVQSESHNNIISNNKITSSNMGIKVDKYSDHNTIQDNKIQTSRQQNSDGSDTGILLRRSSENIVVDNTIKNSAYGIWIDGASNNIVKQNVIENCGESGITITRYVSYDPNTRFTLRITSNNNQIYHNVFVNSFQVAIYSEQNTVWDNGVQGNHWSNYNGTDTDGDGIGDTPYIINANNQDNHPIIEAAVIPEFPSLAVLVALIALCAVLALFYQKLLTVNTR
ncbi:MAG: right-handed parallel beta-helix repeat-containing protein, partial [Candidatus Bathyarchaeota archaeon]|nr:right-handed parallel beta-helix repeat-containing protein [Candidatus Bathyarchaeota archaeon]